MPVSRENRAWHKFFIAGIEIVFLILSKFLHFRISMSNAIRLHDSHISCHWKWCEISNTNWFQYSDEWLSGYPLWDWLSIWNTFLVCESMEKSSYCTQIWTISNYWHITFTIHYWSQLHPNQFKSDWVEGFLFIFYIYWIFYIYLSFK